MEDLCHHHNSLMFQNKAWLIMGDFNEILDGGEHSGADRGVRSSIGMRDFQNMALHCHLSDIGHQRPLLTWCNKREEGLVCKKLDRVLINDVALHIFANAYSVFKPGGCSDHMRCMIHIRHPFKYVNAVGRLPNFLAMVKEY